MLGPRLVDYSSGLQHRRQSHCLRPPSATHTHTLSFTDIHEVSDSKVSTEELTACAVGVARSLQHASNLPEAQDGAWGGSESHAHKHMALCT